MLVQFVQVHDVHPILQLAIKRRFAGTGTQGLVVSRAAGLSKPPSAGHDVDVVPVLLVERVRDVPIVLRALEEVQAPFRRDQGDQDEGGGVGA
eukprot:CAMPEP_0198199758 /NCGR_PEP_ID=MMETSP1445-20131203/2936_1 /TAXON_ID=36898 /ORGANISM="Pyramimonas sp., Strain CCMP2087" /LENGTH=92 /DNA_ID=CAMNT_0043869651 /DNA_START=182 /DNA_END=460 /DNA_ORIENTATION=-